jgi:hypothetical protein
MADIRAVKTGVWSDPTVWTPNPPAAGDVVRPNNFTVTIDVNVSVTEIRNDAGGGAVLGGSFTLNDGVVVTSSNGFFGTYAGASIGLLNYGGAGSVIINGNVEGSKSAVSNTCAISNNSTGTITINGNISSSGSGATSQTLRNQSTGTFIVNGNLTSVSGELIRNVAGTTTIMGNITTNSGTTITNTSGTVTVTGNFTNNSVGLLTTVTNSGNGTISFIGSVSGANNTSSNTANITILNNSTGTINVTGDVNVGGGIRASGTVTSITIRNASSGTVNITGQVTGPSVFTGTVGTLVISAVNNNSSGIVNIIGNCIGVIGDTSSGNAVSNTGSGTINITGNAIGGSTGLAVANNSTGTITLNGNAIGGTSFFAIESVNAAGNFIIEKAIYSNLGQSPITGYIKFKTTNPEIDVLRTDNVIVTLRDPLNVSGLLPATNNVRSGTIYNTGSSTGTLAMPAPNLVQLGVPVGVTFGTANLTPGDFWDYLISNGFATGSIGERLKVSSTIDTTLAQIASFS